MADKIDVTVELANMKPNQGIIRKQEPQKETPPETAEGTKEEKGSNKPLIFVVGLIFLIMIIIFLPGMSDRGIVSVNNITVNGKVYANKVTGIQDLDIHLGDRSMKFLQLDISENIELTLDKINVSFKNHEVLDAYEVDLSGLEFELVILHDHADGEKLYACTDWNEGCQGSWKKVKDFEIDEEYFIELSNKKYAFAEV